MRLLALLFGLVIGAAACDQDSSQLKIINGVEVEEMTHVAKHTVALIRDNGVAYCTGTLIAPEWVLTAGHCFPKYPQETKVFVSFGHAILSPDEMDIISGRVYRHENFSVIPNPEIHSFHFDVSLVHLKRPAPSFMTPVELGSKEDIFVGQDVILAGYGDTKRDEDNPNLLRWTTSKIDMLMENVIIFRSENGLNGVCFGDSGGPMFIVKGDRLVQIGTTEGPYLPNPKSVRHCRQQGVYQNVDSHAAWIAETMKKHARAAL